jgi:diguanylate cyclase (GGDEF)-like protein
MKLFLDRHKTLLPRVDVIYFLMRILALVGLVWFSVDGGHQDGDTRLLILLTATYCLHMAIFLAAIKNRFDLKLAYFSAILYDLLFIPVFVMFTGGINSSFFLLYYMTVTVSAYILVFWFSMTITALATASYLICIWPEITIDGIFDVSMRIGLMWSVFLGISYVSDFLRRSETRLMKLFDTLNQRTSELEKSHSQLEMIYENTRILAAILDNDGVIREVMRIMSLTLHYETCGVILKDKFGNFYFRARLVEGTKNFQLKALDVRPTDLIRKVSQMHEAVRIKDMLEREDYDSLMSKARSVMLVPMTSHNQTQGLLLAESGVPDSYSERDLQAITIVARSAALALENSDLHKQMEEMTIIDELTETYNYRYFVQKLQDEKKRALRYGSAVSIIMVDIDWFKKLNDTYGHEVGNIVLKELSRAIKKCIRDVDIFARYGGEEFVIILPQTPQVEAAHIGERIRDLVEHTVVDAGKSGKLKITVSVGVSSFPENGRSQEELVSVADQALYQAKGSGKNLVCTI